MRIFSALLAVGLVPALASAQDALPSAAIQMGLPSAALDRRPVAPGPRDLFRATPSTYAPGFDELPRFDRRFFPCCGAVFSGPFFVPDAVLVPFAGFANELGPVAPSWAKRAAIDRARALESIGYLRLLVEPDTAQVYVDGFYVGTVADVAHLVRVQPGAHRIELRASGHEPAVFDVHVFATETVTYRTTLRRIAPAEKPPAPAPGAAKTFYVIPNCYAGDRLPDREALLPGCDIARLRVIPPR